MGKFFAAFFVILFLFYGLLVSPINVVHADVDPTNPTGATSLTEDPRVTFSGKFASRASNFLDWTLDHFRWSAEESNSTNALTTVWRQNRNFVYLSLVSFIMITGFILIATRGRSLSASRFFPLLIFVALGVTFSYALIRLLYQLTDIVTGFFLRNPAGGTIGAKDLLNIDFGYVDFVGYRLPDSVYDESVFMTLSLVELTAITYYILAGILLFRKIVLWFFILLSPFFPLIAFFPPMRNTAIAWGKHFFRWLLYGPIFAVLFSGLVVIWQTGIPLPFNFTGLGKYQLVAYPTATNIEISGPGLIASSNNSLNTVDTYALFIVALLMLWGVILLPILLSRVSFEYFHGLARTHIFSNQHVQNLTSMYRDFGIGKKERVAPTPRPNPEYYPPKPKTEL